jgi:Raf kinase inhibitor-like YbhB/YbcL family protein
MAIQILYVIFSLLNNDYMSLTKEEVGTLTISSPAFKEGADIPAKYTCQGENINPEIDILGIPKEAKTLALIMEDPDAPHGTFDHWLLWNMNPIDKIAENSLPGIPGTNSSGEVKYKGPCPPSGSHRYYFKVYALDTVLPLAEGERKEELTRQMKGHIVAKGELMGRYKKS